MKNIEIVCEGYEGIPAMAETLTEDELRQLARGRDVTLLPHAIAAIKKAQEGIAVTMVSVFDENGAAVEGSLSLHVGDALSLKGTHVPETSTAETRWTNSDGSTLKMDIDAADRRKVSLVALKAGSSTLKCECGAGSASIAVTVA